MLESVILTCLFISVAPYYDCSETITIMVSDQMYIPCNDKGGNLGCAKLGKRGDRQYILLGKSAFIYEDKYGNDVLWHEIKHIRCQCNWHRELDRSLGYR